MNISWHWHLANLVSLGHHEMPRTYTRTKILLEFLLPNQRPITLHHNSWSTNTPTTPYTPHIVISNVCHWELGNLVPQILFKMQRMHTKITIHHEFSVVSHRPDNSHYLYESISAPRMVLTYTTTRFLFERCVFRFRLNAQNAIYLHYKNFFSSSFLLSTTFRTSFTIVYTPHIDIGIVCHY